MFSIFKSKKEYLKDLTHGFTDIHSHLLYGIDDGAKSIEDTKFLLASFLDLGFKKAITTPHTIFSLYDNTSASINERYQLVKQELPELSEKLDLRVASEYLMDDSFMQKIKTKDILCLKDNYVLVEMSYLNPPIQLLDIIFELQVAGYQPVLAHPERYLFYHRDFDKYKTLKNQGCKFQVNLLSTVGYYGAEVAAIADKLLQEGMIDFAGSDIHHQKHVASFQSPLRIKNVSALKEAIANNIEFE